MAPAGPVLRHNEAMPDRVTEHTTIAADPEVVRAVLLDFPTYPEWAKDLKAIEVIDEVLPEPAGGAHRDPAATAQTVGAALRRHLQQLQVLKPSALVADRYRKFRAMGVFAGAAERA